MSLATKPFVVTTIGTCRIADPMMAATKRRPIKRANQRVYGFVHTSREILQQVDCIEGRELPPELVPFLAPVERALGRDVDTSPDLYLVEVSTTKELHFREWLLQGNYMERCYDKARPLFEIFKKTARIDQREQRRSLIEAHPLFGTLSPIQRDVLLETYVHLTTREELERDLLEIARRLPNRTLFVCHVDVDDIGGAPLASRRSLCSWMREICATHGLALIDPITHVAAYGRTRALADAGRDLNHYSEEFKPLFGSLIYDLYCNPGDNAADAASLLHEAWPGSGGSEQTSPQEDVMGDPIQEPAPRSPFERIRQHVNKGELEMAEALLADIDGGLAEFELMHGMIAIRRDDQPKAEAHLRAALAIDAAAMEAKSALTKLLLGQARLEEAVTLAGEILSDPAHDTKALSGAARVFSKARQFHHAAAASYRIAELVSDDPGGLIDAARYELKAAKYEEGLAAADAALARAPGSLTALTLKAEALGRLRRVPELAPVLVLLAPTSPELAMRHLRSVIAAGLTLEAAAILAGASGAGFEDEDAAELKKEILRALNEKATVAAEANDTRAAVISWKAIQQLDPESKRARLGIRNAVAPFIEEGRRLVAAEDLSAAAEAYRAGLALDADNARALRELASVLERAKEWPEAAEIWRRLADTPDGGPEALARGARSARNARLHVEAMAFFGRMDEAQRTEFADAIASSLRHLTSQMREAFNSGDYDIAIGRIKAVLAIDPEHVHAERFRQKTTSALVRSMRAAKGDDGAQRDLSRKVLSIEPSHREATSVLIRLSSEAKREFQQRSKMTAPG